MALRGYFDGSGKKNDPQCQAITLAGISASEGVWPDFEQAWHETLGNLGLRLWHTSDIRHFMTDEAFCRAASKLLDTIFDFRERPMVSYRATVLLSDYRRAKAEIPSLMAAEALCVNGCLGNLVIPTEEDLPVIIYFDKDEPFMREIDSVWRKRKKRYHRDWSRQIEDILPTNSTKCGIQAADLFAWLSNTYEVTKREGGRKQPMLMELCLHAFFSAHARLTIYDYGAIIAAHERRQDT